METQNGTTTNGSHEKATGRCAANGTFHELDKKALTTRKTNCPGCGKQIDIKDKHFNDDFSGMTIPNHNRLIVEPPAPPPVQATLSVADTAPPRPGDTVLRSPEGDLTVLDRAPVPIVVTEPICGGVSAQELFHAEIIIDTGDVVDFYAVAPNFMEASIKFGSFIGTNLRIRWKILSIKTVTGELLA